jgi:hypothetical protein
VLKEPEIEALRQFVAHVERLATFVRDVLGGAPER